MPSRGLARFNRVVTNRGTRPFAAWRRPLLAAMHVDEALRLTRT